MNRDITVHTVIKKHNQRYWFKVHVCMPKFRGRGIEWAHKRLMTLKLAQEIDFFFIMEGEGSEHRLYFWYFMLLYPLL